MTDQRIKEAKQIAAAAITGGDDERIAAALALNEFIAEVEHQKKQQATVATMVTSFLEGVRDSFQEN